MIKILSQLNSLFTGYEFFSPKYLSDPQMSAARFNKALKESRECYEQKKHLKIAPELIHESWLQNITALESYFIGQMDADFISNEVINGTMVFTNREAHKLEMVNVSAAYDRNMVEQVISKGLNAAFLSGRSRRSNLINSVHHLHHLMRFEQETGRKIKDIGSVVEFGGGYGNMARIVNNIGSCTKYSIVDLLLFSCIQYVFLSTVDESGQAVFDNHAESGDAKFLLSPMFRTDSSSRLQGELFLSTWALSESTRAAYEWVVTCDWFEASSLLLAYNEHWKPWRANELEQTLANGGWRVIKEPISFLPESFYLFATR